MAASRVACENKAEADVFHAGRYDAADEPAFPVDDLYVCRRPGIDHHRRSPVARERRHRIGHAVGAYFAWLRVCRLEKPLFDSEPSRAYQRVGTGKAA